MKFLPVVGYECSYEVSDTGTLRSLDRVVTGRDSTHYPFRGRVLRPAPNKHVEYLQVSLWLGGVGTSHYVHRLVAGSHIPNPHNLPEVNHKDGVRLNNYASNLEWVTQIGNIQHAISTRLKIYTNRLTKDEFVECLFAVINGESYFELCKRVPYKVPFLSTKIRQIATELSLVSELDQSLYEQKVIRARINGAKNQ